MKRTILFFFFCFLLVFCSLIIHRLSCVLWLVSCWTDNFYMTTINKETSLWSGPLPLPQACSLSVCSCLSAAYTFSKRKHKVFRFCVFKFFQYEGRVTTKSALGVCSFFMTSSIFDRMSGWLEATSWSSWRSVTRLKRWGWPFSTTSFQLPMRTPIWSVSWNSQYR